MDCAQSIANHFATALFRRNCLMRKIDIMSVTEGMKLAKTIYSADGRPLLNAKTELKSSYINRLKRLGVPAIFVYSPHDDLEEKDPGEALSETTKAEAIKTVSNVMSNVVNRRSIDSKPIKDVVGVMIDDITNNRDILLGLSDIRTADTYTFSHSVNVCVLAVLIGLNTDLNELELRNLGIGALLHDIGKTDIPPDILKKPGRLSRTEFNVIKNHTTIGFNMLRKVEGINILSAHVSYQHHECLDGSGYPRNLKQTQIHPFGLIGGVADTYDALSADRVYRPAMHPSEAIKVLKQQTDTRFDKGIVDALMKNIALYPLGSVVHLNSGEKCEVIKVTKDHVKSPLVRVLQNEDGSKPTKGMEIDLAKDKSRHIIKAAYALEE